MVCAATTIVDLSLSKSGMNKYLWTFEYCAKQYMDPDKVNLTPIISAASQQLMERNDMMYDLTRQKDQVGS